MRTKRPWILCCWNLELRKRNKMKRWLKAFSVVFLGLVTGAIHVYCQLYDAEGSSSGLGKESVEKPVIFGWIEKAPYVTSPTNGSSDNEPHGMIRDALHVLQHIEDKCEDNIIYEVDFRKVGSEFEMLELIKQNRVHIAVPIFENPTSRRYSEFPFFKIDDYPGTDYIKIKSKKSVLSVVLFSVSKSWPLLAVTLVLTAIAGIIMWALDTFWNREEFPRSFIRGSWDGFWWSFISMTTVGYGDKTPKSIIARIFSIIWIMFGLIVMAIFTANVTSNLTAVSLEMEPSNLAGLKVAVLGNGTEYQHALHESAHPEVYNKTDDIIQDLESEKVDGLLLDRYSTSYYQARNKLRALLLVKKFEFRTDVGILFSKDTKDLADCLNYYRSDIWSRVQTITSTFKISRRKTVENFNLFDNSSPFVKQFLYISLGLLCGLLIIGILWEVFTRQKAKLKHNVRVGEETEVTTPRETIHHDLETVRNLLEQMQENFNKLEEKVLILQDSQRLSPEALKP